MERKKYLAEKQEWFSKSANNLSLYSGNHVGFLGGICQKTEVPGILCWDCVKTDWFHSAAYPTFMLYNPHDEPKQVTLKLQKRADLYDLVAGKFVARGAERNHPLRLGADQVVVLVATPRNGKISQDNGRFKVNSVTVDFRVP